MAPLLLRNLVFFVDGTGELQNMTSTDTSWRINFVRVCKEAQRKVPTADFLNIKSNLFTVKSTRKVAS